MRERARVREMFLDGTEVSDALCGCGPGTHKTLLVCIRFAGIRTTGLARKQMGYHVGYLDDKLRPGSYIRMFVGDMKVHVGDTLRSQTLTKCPEQKYKAPLGSYVYIEDKNLLDSVTSPRARPQPATSVNLLSSPPALPR